MSLQILCFDITCGKRLLSTLSLSHRRDLGRQRALRPIYITRLDREQPNESGRNNELAEPVDDDLREVEAERVVAGHETGAEFCNKVKNDKDHKKRKSSNYYSDNGLLKVEVDYI
jgi:hypothetical protein